MRRARGAQRRDRAEAALALQRTAGAAKPWQTRQVTGAKLGKAQPGTGKELHTEEPQSDPVLSAEPRAEEHAASHACERVQAPCESQPKRASETLRGGPTPAATPPSSHAPAHGTPNRPCSHAVRNPPGAHRRPNTGQALDGRRATPVWTHLVHQESPGVAELTGALLKFGEGNLPCHSRLLGCEPDANVHPWACGHHPSPRESIDEPLGRTHGQG